MTEGKNHIKVCNTKDPSTTVQEQQQDDEHTHSLANHPPAEVVEDSCSTADMTASLSSRGIDDLLEEIHKWFILEGGHLQGVKPFLAAYFHKLRALEIPLDMIFGGGVLLSEYTPGFLWTCESSDDLVDIDSVCAEIEISREQFKIYTASLEADDPFVRLRLGTPSVRLQAGKDPIPAKSCAWYHAKKMTDYFALPILYKGTFRGGFAWATRTAGGFEEHHLSFFEKAMPAFSAIMRLQTNDLIMESLTVRVEAEITERTTSLQIANKELEQANGRIQQQAAAQLEHFACMSHEVRTPLNCILGMSNLLLEDEEAALTPSQKDMIQLITTSGNLLRTVVDDVLDYTKLAAGHMDIQIKSCNLQEIVLQSVRAFQGQCQARKLNLRPHFGPNVPEFVQSDHRRLSQILYNLIGNAVKFSKDGGNIDIALSLVETDNNKKQLLKLTIKDYGKGIEQKDLDNIFQPFYQTDTRTSESTYGGTGLGLSIASKIVHGLGGTIAADSELGKWCQFTVELPCTSHRTVDTTKIQKMLQNNVTMALILPDSERERLTRDVLGPYGVEAQVLKSCGDLHELGTHSFARSYVVMCHNTLYDQEKVESFTRWEGKRRVTIITCGAARSKVTGQTDAHFEFLSLVFPSVVMQKLCVILESKLSGAFKTNQPAFPLIEGESIATSKPTSQLPEKTATSKPTDQAPEKTSIISTPQQPTLQEAKKTTIVAPKPTVQVAKTTTTNATTPTTPYSCLKVLITEDNLINQKVLHKALSRLGLQNVDIVDNGAKAVALTAEKPFDLIFMDIQMPVMDGLEATKLITSRRDKGLKENQTKKDKTKHDLPTVIFVSAHATDSYREKALAVGGDGFIAKPFQLPKIKDALQSVLHDAEDI